MLQRQPILLRAVIALMLAIATAWLWPAGTGTWRKIAAITLSVALGFQTVVAFEARRRGRVAAIRAWLECLAFPLAMGAFYYLPSARGWILLLASWSWRFWILNLWHRKG